MKSTHLAEELKNKKQVHVCDGKILKLIFTTFSLSRLLN
jgi:hypothetical protein